MERSGMGTRYGWVMSALVPYEFDPSIGDVGQAVSAWTSGWVTSST